MKKMFLNSLVKKNILFSALILSSPNRVHIVFGGKQYVNKYTVLHLILYKYFHAKKS